MDEFLRTEWLLGKEAVEKLSKARVAVFGLGGVGGYVVEALVRAGVGEFDLVDGDVFSPTNLNRQLHALQSTIGRKKTEVVKERILSINPSAKVHLYDFFYSPETAERIDFSPFDYIADAIDDINGKVLIACRARDFQIPLISSMGAGNKLDPTLFQVTDLYKTQVCPLARAMRERLRKCGIERLKVVYSPEPPKKSNQVGSVSFVPSVAGLILAGEIVKDLIQIL